MDPGALVALAIGVLGLGGIVFTALKFNRDDTTAIVGQQSNILRDMKELNSELRITATDLRKERDELKEQVDKLGQQVTELSTELREAHAQLSEQVSRVQDTLDG